MEIGVDILNPIQATANNLVEVRKRTAGKMTLEGGISSKIISEGTPDQIRSEVKRVIRILGADGGYFCSPDGGSWPKENYEAFCEAVEEFGKYPFIF